MNVDGVLVLVRMVPISLLSVVLSMTQIDAGHVRVSIFMEVSSIHICTIQISEDIEGERVSKMRQAQTSTT